MADSIVGDRNVQYHFGTTYLTGLLVLPHAADVLGGACEFAKCFHYGRALVVRLIEVAAQVPAEVAAKVTEV